jgi:hypothetical protein
MLKKWKMADHYAGEVWPEYFVFLGQHRDSDALTRSNFIRGLELIGGECETVQVVRERHWAVGWVEWIAIHQDDALALALASDIADKLEDYPVIDEDHFGELEYAEACDYWASMSIRSRAEIARDCGASIFSARRAYPPEGADEWLR